MVLKEKLPVGTSRIEGRLRLSRTGSCRAAHVTDPFVSSFGLLSVVVENSMFKKLVPVIALALLAGPVFAQSTSDTSSSASSSTTKKAATHHHKKSSKSASSSSSG